MLLPQHRRHARLTVKIGSDLVSLTSGESVALSATGLEETSTLLSVAYRHPSRTPNETTATTTTTPIAVKLTLCEWH